MILSRMKIKFKIVILYKILYASKPIMRKRVFIASYMNYKKRLFKIPFARYLKYQKHINKYFHSWCMSIKFPVLSSNPKIPNPNFS